MNCLWHVLSCLRAVAPACGDHRHLVKRKRKLILPWTLAVDVPAIWLNVNGTGIAIVMPAADNNVLS